jgi:hypothetical protein
MCLRKAEIDQCTVTHIAGNQFPDSGL